MRLPRFSSTMSRQRPLRQPSRKRMPSTRNPALLCHSKSPDSFRFGIGNHSRLAPMPQPLADSVRSMLTSAKPRYARRRNTGLSASIPRSAAPIAPPPCRRTDILRPIPPSREPSAGTWRFRLRFLARRWSGPLPNDWVQAVGVIWNARYFNCRKKGGKAETFPPNYLGWNQHTLQSGAD
jgi:hypothetical protein